MVDGIALMSDSSFMPLQMRVKPGLPLVQKEGMKLDAKTDDQAAQLRKVAEDFEAVFLYQMMKQMRNSIHKEDMFHGGAGEDIFTEMLDEEFSKRMASRGSVGIADMLFRQLSRQYGIGEPADAMPDLSGQAGALQQKLQSAQSQVRAQEPRPVVPDL